MKTKPTEKFNVQRRCEEIHAQYGTSEMATYRIQQMCDKIAQDAFDEGKQSVIDNVKVLEWIDFGNGDWYMHTPFFDYGIQMDCADSKFYIKALGGYISTLGFDTSEEAKLFAEEDYKNRIKQALGL